MARRVVRGKYPQAGHSVEVEFLDRLDALTGPGLFSP
jgi:hypothetical protein